MSARPNFTGARLSGESVMLEGTSDPEPEGDIIGIRVVLSQGTQVTPADVHRIGGSWEVQIPGEGFGAGAATAFGVEMRHEHATTITWSQLVDITG